MDALTALYDKSLKSIEKREIVVSALREKTITVKDIEDILNENDEKKSAIVFEAMEAVTSSDPLAADARWLNLAVKYISSSNNNIKREASRIVGNISCNFPDKLEKAIEKLLLNTNDAGTVVRWSSAYALSKIIVIPSYANSELYEKLTEICIIEEENGVKNQYVKALKKAAKLRI